MSTTHPPFDLDAARIDVWPLRLEAPAAVIECFAAVLDAQERARRDRFAFQRLRDSFALSRGALRALLGRYLDIAAEDVAFRTGSKGKPCLRGDTNLRFNLSHSGGLGLFAFAREVEIGADLEVFRPLADLGDIARRYFCREEFEELMKLDARQREDAFFLCWTRKEAYLKAVGNGLAAPLDSFRVTLEPGQEARMLHVEDDSEAARRWTLHDLSVAPGFAAALAYKAAPREIRLHPVREPADLLGA
ncbi:MAG TPA: 4'-phosphopantetheinyl transferase superfamily protein [Acidobacteriota bacterium]|nr:4'-phosphopantetheinyl transferase superfamily protein [Acidobacteriota bacterium]